MPVSAKQGAYMIWYTISRNSWSVWHQVFRTRVSGSPNLQDLFLRAAVKRRCGLVAEQDAGIFEECPRQGHALLLSAAELQAPLSHPHLVPLWHPHDLVMYGCLPGCLHSSNCFVKNLLGQK